MKCITTTRVTSIIELEILNYEETDGHVTTKNACKSTREAIVLQDKPS